MNGAQRALGAGGALCCAAAVALAAYSSHGLQGEHAHRGALAAAFAFAHGLALVALARHADSRVRLLGLVMLAGGIVLFSGTLAVAAIAGTSTALAPAGGVLLMLGWTTVAAGLLRR